MSSPSTKAMVMVIATATATAASARPAVTSSPTEIVLARKWPIPTWAAMAEH